MKAPIRFAYLPPKIRRWAIRMLPRYQRRYIDPREVMAIRAGREQSRPRERYPLG